MSWIGTRFHHGAALRGIGCDCIGLVVGVGRACGLVPLDYHMPAYSPQWHVHRREQLLRNTMEASGCQPVPLPARQPGHLLLFEFGRTWSHVGILVSCDPDYLIHAFLPQRGVVHQRLAGQLAARLRACYAYPGGEACP